MTIAETTVIHPTAVIQPGAKIAAGCHIGPFCMVGAEVQLGENVELKSHVALDGWTDVGAGTVIFPFASIGHIPQDLKFGGERTKLEIGARNRIREYVTMNPGTEGGGGLTKVGDDSLFMMGVHVGHDCILGDNIVLANNASLGGHCQIGDHVIIGALAGIHQFVRVGKGAMIGGLAAVVGDVIPFGSVIGERADLGGLNLVGLKRRGVDRPTVNGVRAAYKQLFWGEGNLRQRADKVRRDYADNPLVQEITDFLLDVSDRSFTTPD